MTADQLFLQQGYRLLEDSLQHVNATIDTATAQLNATTSIVAANPLRNYSFQKMFYQWSKQTEWFGIQVYRSLRLLASQNESIAIGSWRFTEKQNGLEERLYLSIKAEEAKRYQSACANTFQKHFPIRTAATDLSPDGTPCAWFAVLSPKEDPSRLIVAIARDLMPHL